MTTLPRKHSKKFLKTKKGFETISLLMGKYLSKWDVPCGKENPFAEMFWSLIVEKAKSADRVILPHNLGYLQVLEHQYEGKDRQHLLKFGNKDYSLIWFKHPLFLHHRINFDKAIQEELRQRKMNGTRYLNEYVDGDTYVA